MDYIKIFFYTFLFILIVYHYKQSSLLKEKFGDVCMDEDNIIRELQPKPKPKAKSKPKNPKEVYYINYKFNYLEAQEICKSYNGTLATLKQLENAHNNGANWCKWGWLSNETVGYPVQEKYWMDMEGRHKGHCGPTAGINKLYNINPLQKYGVNCYGIKPKKTKNDKELDELRANTETINAEQIKKCKESKHKANRQKWIKKHKKNISILDFNDSIWSNSRPTKGSKQTKKNNKYWF